MNIRHPLTKSIFAATTLLALASCQDDAQINRLQEEIRTLTDQQGQTQSELTRMKMQLNSLGKEKDTLKEDKSRLEAELEGARKTLEQMQKDFASYRSQYKLSMKTRAPGLPLGDLLVDGKAYVNVKVREATDELLTVIHDTGTQKFAWNILPDRVQKLFGVEAPGEFVTISIKRAPESQVALSVDQRITVHDAKVLDLEQRISTLESEISNIGKAEKENHVAISTSNLKQLDTVNLRRAGNALAVKRTQLEAEISGLKKRQDQLMRENPRRNRF